MKKYIAAALVAAVVGISAPAHASTWVSADGHHVRIVPKTKQDYTLVLGDSIAKYTATKLAVLHPDWIQDVKDARSVDEVYFLIRYWTWRKGRAPARIVVALGTGPGSFVPADYQKIRAALPDRTRILFVTLYRSSPPASPELAQQMAELSDGMKQAAQLQYKVCVADWRALVVADRVTLKDGVHPDVPSRATWAHLVSTSMRTCPRPAPDPTPSPDPSPTAAVEH